jgi:hypothetical protein
MYIRFNLMGLVMFFGAIGASMAFGRTFATQHQGLRMIVTGIVLSLIDLAVRKGRDRGLFGAGGGTMLFLPMWLWGILFAAAGAVHIVRGY